ncbi:MAG: hypothetical protein HYY03_03645 [Chloroflexi bacterium]|nr:hypothetical protein [Chloroflexota bacterium]
MSRQAALGALLALTAAAAALTMTALGPAVAGSASIGAVAVDADPSGNGPRSVAGIQECVSAAVGQPVEIDVVIPTPGVPAERGIAAYQFTLYYNPDILWVEADDNKLLLAQAAGSNLVSISDPKPDKNGVYISWGVDFGPSGIEPGGSSETGSGAISRITLTPRKNGHSTLALQDVIILDDDSEPIAVDAVLGANVYVGAACPGQTAAPTPTLTPSATAPPAASPSAAPATVSRFSATGGRPPGPGQDPPWLLIAGLAAASGGLWLLSVTWHRRRIE